MWGDGEIESGIGRDISSREGKEGAGVRLAEWVRLKEAQLQIH